MFKTLILIVASILLGNVIINYLTYSNQNLNKEIILEPLSLAKKSSEVHILPNIGKLAYGYNILKGNPNN